MALKRTGAKRQKKANGAAVRVKQFVEPDKVHVRNTFGRKLNECLLRGLEELKTEIPDFDANEDDVQTLTNRICDACHDYFSYDRRVFKQKLFDIYVNIKRENNHDLRRKVLTGAMSVYDLIHAETRELAPDYLQQRRQLEVEKHYLRNVILPGERGGKARHADAAAPAQHPINEYADHAATLTPLKRTEGSSRHSLDSLGDLSLFSNDSESQTQSDFDDDDASSDDDNADAETAATAGEAHIWQHRAAGDGAAAEGAAGAAVTEDTSQHGDKRTDGDAYHTPQIAAEAAHLRPNSADDMPFLISIKNKILAEEETPPRLPAPPDASKFTLQKVLQRIEKRLDEMPTYIAKPFRGPLKCGNKRVTLLMSRSHILQSREQRANRRPL